MRLDSLIIRDVALLLVCCLAQPAGAIRAGGGVTEFSGGGGGSGSIPPLSPPGGGAGGTGPLFVNLTGGSVFSFACLPTFVHVTSVGQASGPWWVHVRTDTGVTLALAPTDASGDVSFLLPAFPGLMLDVLGSDAEDVPLLAGQSITVVIE